MQNLLASMADTSNPTLVVTLLILAVMRIFLEVIGYDFCALPMTKMIAQRKGEADAKKIHRLGLYLSIGYIVLFAPSILFS